MSPLYYKVKGLKFPFKNLNQQKILYFNENKTWNLL